MVGNGNHALCVDRAGVNEGEWTRGMIEVFTAFFGYNLLLNNEPASKLSVNQKMFFLRFAASLVVYLT